MTIDVDIQVQDGKVTIIVGGQSPSTSGKHQIVGEGEVGAPAGGGKKGGDGAAEGPGPGGGPGGGPSSCALVIGPIVVDCSVLQSTDGGKKGGDGAAEGPGPGGGPPGGAPGSGVVVIGPIVIGNCSAGAVAPGSKPVKINP